MQFLAKDLHFCVRTASSIFNMHYKSDYFLFPYLILLVSLLLIQIQVDQFKISILINSLHNSFLDFLCKYGTWLGDGFFALALSLMLFWFNPRLACCILISYLISAGLAQFLKHIVFPHQERPMAIIQNLQINSLHFVDGVEMNYQNSFPSGHTTTAFALFASISFFLNKPSSKILCLIIALFIGFSRIYLLQHFLIDTCMGSIIGTFTAFLVYFFLIQKGGYQRLAKN